MSCQPGVAPCILLLAITGMIKITYAMLPPASSSSKLRGIFNSQLLTRSRVTSRHPHPLSRLDLADIIDLHIPAALLDV